MTKREITKKLNAAIRVSRQSEGWYSSLPGKYGTRLYRSTLKKNVMTHKRNTIKTLAALLAEEV